MKTTKKNESIGNILIPIVFSITIILSAVADALFFKGQKAESKIIESVFIIILFYMPILYKNINIINLFKLGIVYLFLRIALFDVFFNLTSGSELIFTGTTTPIYDDIMKKLTSWQNITLRFWFLFLALIVYFKSYVTQFSNKI